MPHCLAAIAAVIKGLGRKGNAMKLDSNAAWKDAMTAISANRETFAAIAGVFFLLPSLALGLFVPQPDPPAGVTGEQAVKLMTDFYTAALPFIVPMVVLQTVGTLAILTLCTDRSRPTVGEAIMQGFAGFLPYLGASLLMGLAITLVGGLVLALATATKSGVLVGLVSIALIAAIIYALLRFSLISPAIAVERLRNPVAAMQRSWALTGGNAGRILLFLALIFVTYLVLTMVITAIVGAIVAVAAGVEAVKVSASVLSAVLGAGLTVIVTAVLAKIHGQLAGQSPESIGATFD
jgi:hypothetical protein